MALSPDIHLARLTPPGDPVDLVLDTDTFNEIDDQFALVYAALAAEKLRLRAVHAAPFHNDRSEGPGDGMEKSHAEILRLFDLLGRDPEGVVYRGSTEFTHEATAPESSAATEKSVCRLHGERTGRIQSDLGFGSRRLAAEWSMF